MTNTDHLLSPRTDDAVAFLEQFHPEGQWHLVGITDDKPLIGQTFNQRDPTGRWIDDCQGKWNIYFHVARLRGRPRKGKASKSDLAETSYLHVDVDNAQPETLARLRAWCPKFTAIVMSGGGYHAYYKLTEPTDDFEAIEACNEALAKAFGGDVNAHNADRIMRLPGTINLPNASKRAKGRTDTLAQLVEEDWSRSYDIDLLEAIFTSDHLVAVMSGDDTHDPALRFVGQLVNATDDDALIEQVVNAALPDDYKGDTRSELPGMIRSARKKLASGKWKSKAHRHKYDPGSDGPHPMGYTRDARFALLVRNSVILVNSAQLTSPQFLIGLAPLEFWKEQFPPVSDKQLTFATFKAAEALIQACTARGAYDPARTRGRGVWREGSNIIVNFGGPLPDNTENTYLCFNKVEVGRVETFETARLLEMLRIWPWKHPSSAVLYLGWLAFAPVCGAANWRPHVHLTGGAGSGKSALHALARRLLHQVALTATGISSAAGIRQDLGPDSRPVMMDDCDENKEMAQIVHLMRMASSSDDPTLRGTPEGKAQRFTPVTSFHITSVGQVPMLQQDVERTVQLELTKHASDREEGERLKRELQHFESCGKDWFGYCVGNVVELLQPNIDMFNLALPIENQRHRLTLATLLGAAFAAMHRRVSSEREAGDWVQEHAAATEEHVLTAEDRNSAAEALNYLLYHKPYGEQRALGHHIAMAGLIAINPLLGEPIEEDDDGRTKWFKGEYRRSRTVLYNHTIMVKRNKDDDLHYEVFLMNEAPAINKIFEKTKWEGGWKGIIARVPGAAALTNAVYFSSHKKTARGVVIPGGLIPEPDLGEADDDDKSEY